MRAAPARCLKRWSSRSSRALRRVVLALEALTIALAASIALLPLPAEFVERYYASWLYPALQSHLTSWSNTSGISLFDVLVLVLATALAIAWIRIGRSAWR